MDDSNTKVISPIGARLAKGNVEALYREFVTMYKKEQSALNKNTTEISNQEPTNSVGSSVGLPSGQLYDNCPLCTKADAPGHCSCLDSKFAIYPVGKDELVTNPGGAQFDNTMAATEKSATNKQALAVNKSEQNVNLPSRSSQSQDNAVSEKTYTMSQLQAGVLAVMKEVESEWKNRLNKAEGSSVEESEKSEATLTSTDCFNCTKSKGKPGKLCEKCLKEEQEESSVKKFEYKTDLADPGARNAGKIEFPCKHPGTLPLDKPVKRIDSPGSGGDVTKAKLGKAALKMSKSKSGTPQAQDSSTHLTTGMSGALSTLPKDGATIAKPAQAAKVAKGDFGMSDSGRAHTAPPVHAPAPAAPKKGQYTAAHFEAAKAKLKAPPKPKN